MVLLDNGRISPRRDDSPRRVGTRVERRKARTRARLLAAARHLFATGGVEQTTIAEIAGRADIAIGSFYNYFGTKEELLDALIEELFSEQLRLLQLRQAQVNDPAEKISIAHRHLVRVAQTDSDWAWLLVRLEVPHRVAWAVLGSAARRDLRDGIEGGRFQLANPALALNASGGALFAVIHAQLVGEGSKNASSEHAEGVLRSFGLSQADATEIAHRPLPDAVEPTEATPE
ncbi:MAG TPA: TetR/AcrR family transcriptional regulator [Solirubrobacteraceae bacterium]|nr:TetR/AcrR family transcriptional regulator [Solirubrobacteraceae bacterium]HME01473.1 TetR/AcrR family transcriptional regulator [Solirubrobacteraceae bacterium]